MRFMFYVVGVGGTGSLLARDLPKLLTNTSHRMMLIDNDIVERKNIVRQGYQEQDVGDNKAIALSRKINSLYSTNCLFMDSYVTDTNLLAVINDYKFYIPVILGCIDNDKTRQMIESVVKQLDKVVYIDSANSEYEGNVYIYIKDHEKHVGKMRGEVYKLENDKHPDEVSCLDQVASGNVQYLVTNAKMAIAVLEHCNALLHGYLKGGVQIVRRFETVFY